MERDKQPTEGTRILTVRATNKVVCFHCKNDNLIHGLYLAKAGGRMLIGGPGQIPDLISERWAVYWCIECGSFYPYSKQYPGTPQLQKLYQQIHNWCDQKANQHREAEERLKQLVSIIQANKDLLGLPGINNNNDGLESLLEPIQDQLDDLKKEVYKQKGGRPRNCKIKLCKIKAEIDGLCRQHFIEAQK